MSEPTHISQILGPIMLRLAEKMAQKNYDGHLTIERNRERDYGPICNTSRNRCATAGKACKRWK